MIKDSLFKYKAHIVTGLSLCFLIVISPSDLIADPKLSRGICDKDAVILEGKKFVVNADGSLSHWDSAQNEKCKEVKAFPIICDTSTRGYRQTTEKREAVKLLEDGSAPKGYQILSVNISCPESNLDLLGSGSVADIKWQTTTRGKDIEAVIADGTIVSSDETLKCKNDSSALKLIFSDKNVLKIKLASRTGKLSVHPAHESTQ